MPIPQIDRTALRAAFAVVDQAKQKTDRARQNADRVGQARDAARTSYEAARAQVEAVKQRSLVAFRSGPENLAPSETPGRLRQLREDAEGAEEAALRDLKHHEDASSAMAVELADAQRVLTETERFRGEAAAAVVTLAATAVVEEVQMLLARTKYLREALRGASNGSGEQHIRQQFGGLLASAIDESQEPRWMWPSPMTPSTTYWANLVRALNADPDAPIPELPVPSEFGFK